MSRDITEVIDDYCFKKYGHTNWVIISTLSDQEKVGIDEVAEIEKINDVYVAFYFDKDEGKYFGGNNLNEIYEVNDER